MMVASAMTDPHVSFKSNCANREYKHGKVVDVVESDSFNGVYFQYYNHKRRPVQPAKDAMEQTACTEFPPWKKRGSD